MTADQTSELNFIFSNDNMTQSSWRLRWDAKEDNQSARSQTLLEGTCEIEGTDPTGRKISCWIDISKVELGKRFRVDFSNDTSPPIVAQPPKERRYSERNKPPENVDITVS
jgi:hypothetical protein